MPLKELPLELFQDDLAVLAMKGAGKTYTVKEPLERLLDKRPGTRLCVWDPTGAWWGLSYRPDGKRNAYGIVVFGGQHADVAIDETMGPALAKIVATRKIRCVIDVKQMKVNERSRLFTAFGDELYRLNTMPLHLVIDECHEVLPQMPRANPQAAAMLNVANTLVSGGRLQGLRMVLISQRAQKVHKDSLSQVSAMVVLRMFAPHDIDQVENWIGKRNKELCTRILDSLQTLKTGEGWVYSPTRAILERMRFPRIRTLDSSATPKDGDEGKLDNVLDRLTEHDVQEFKELLHAPPATKPGSRKVMVVNGGRRGGYAFQEGVQEGLRLATEGKRPTADLVKDAEIMEGMAKEAYGRGFREGEKKKLEELANLRNGEHQAIRTLIHEASVAIMDAQVKLDALMNLLKVPQEQWTWQPTDIPPAEQELYRAAHVDGHAMFDRSLVAAGSRLREQQKVAFSQVGDEKNWGLPAGAMRMLESLVRMHPASIPWKSLAVYAGLKARGGGFSVNQKALRSSGFINEIDGKAQASSLGIAKVGPIAKSGDPFKDWLARLDGMAPKILHFLGSRIDPTQFTRPATVADALNRQPHGGAWSSAMKQLRECNLIESDRSGIRWNVAIFGSATRK